MKPSRAVAIIDDDKQVRVANARLIRSLGLAASTFASAPEFLGADVDRFGCVIADVQMPGMSGLQLQQTLKLSAPHLPLIFITAFPNERVRSRAMSEGARSFLEKPCDAETIISTLEEVFGPLPR